MKQGFVLIHVVYQIMHNKLKKLLLMNCDKRKGNYAINEDISVSSNDSMPSNDGEMLAADEKNS